MPHDPALSAETREWLKKAASDLSCAKHALTASPPLFGDVVYPGSFPAAQYNGSIRFVMKKKRIPEKYQVWIDVRKRYRLSDVHIQMARELGMNPKKFGKIANEKQEPWKAPLPAFIERIYVKHFGRERPTDVKSIEELVRTRGQKKEEKRKRKQSQDLSGPDFK